MQSQSRFDFKWVYGEELEPKRYQLLLKSDKGSDGSVITKVIPDNFLTQVELNQTIKLARDYYLLVDHNRTEIQKSSKNNDKDAEYYSNEDYSDGKIYYHDPYHDSKDPNKYKEFTSDLTKGGKDKEQTVS